MDTSELPDIKYIEGVRQQIIANAVHLYRKENFNVILSAAQDDTGYIAMLTTSDKVIIGFGAKKATAYAALCSLLEVTACKIGKAFKRLHGNVTFEEACGGAMADSIWN